MLDKSTFAWAVFLLMQMMYFVVEIIALGAKRHVQNSETRMMIAVVLYAAAVLPWVWLVIFVVPTLR